jgi:hypothetical protein
MKTLHCLNLIVCLIKIFLQAVRYYNAGKQSNIENYFIKQLPRIV